jgi:hypothetical protein
MICPRCKNPMMQDRDREGLLWWFCPDETCNPEVRLEVPA